MAINVRVLFFSWLSVWILIAMLGIYLLYPLRAKLRFGIDLVGGTYITLKVHTDKAVEAVLLENMHQFSSKLEKIPNISIVNKKVENNEVIFEFASVNQAQEAAGLLRETTLVQKTAANRVTFSLPDAKVEAIKSDAITRNVQVLRARLDRMSVAEIPIFAQGKDQIVVELPDVSDPLQAKAMIGKAAVLDFRPVLAYGDDPEEIKQRFGGQIPGDMEILSGKQQGDEVRGYYLVPRYAEITGKYLIDARPEVDENRGEIIVAFQLNQEGGRKFYELTSKHYQKPLAIVLDNIVLNAPIIQARIRDSGTITGLNRVQSRELATLLKSGAFVAPVSFEEERQIGPSLGSEVVHQGLVACLVGLLLLLVFIVIIYRFCGLLAFIALLFNLLLILLGLAWLRVTLTLPGIAGMILTVGMAIDASILIFERIREELSTGSPLRNSVEKGFSDAMAVILDANITTLVVGIVLYKFGTGPIQGFAVTMVLGIFATLITGLFFLRSLLSAVIEAFRVQKLSI